MRSRAVCTSFVSRVERIRAASNAPSPIIRAASSTSPDRKRAVLFERVQRVLALRGGCGTRQRQHHHWLKGLIWCGRCGKRLIVTPGHGNGATYFYFMCRGRQGHSCDQPYLKVQDVERAVEQHYATVRLSDQFRAEVRAQLDDTVLSELGSIDSLKKRLMARLGELDAKEEQFLDLVGEPGWPKGKIKRKLDGIAVERAEIEGQLADTTTKLDAGRQFFTLALDLLANPQAFYRRGNARVKQALTKVIVSKLYLDRESQQSSGALVSGHDLADGFGDLVEAEIRQRACYRRSDGVRGWDGGSTSRAEGVAGGREGLDSSSPLRTEGAAVDLGGGADGAGLLVMALGGQGSSRDVMVELRGFEHLTP